VVNAKQLKARDLALVFMQECKSVYRNVLWNGGYRMEYVKTFIKQTNALERPGNDLDKAFR